MFNAKGSLQGARARSVDPAWLAQGLVAGIALSLLVQAWLIFNHVFVPDEFHFLGQVHYYLRGSLDLPLQTLHVHLFAPLAALPGNEVDQLIAGRLAMLAFECISIVSLYFIARSWSGKGASLLAALAFATMPLTLVHGASFRTDPLALALIMTALALLARAPMRSPVAVAIGLLGAIAFLVTIKVIFFAPAFAGIAAWRVAKSSDPRREAKALAAIAATAAVAAVSLYLLHQSKLQVASVARSGEMLASAGSITIFGAGFMPQSQVFLLAVATAPLQALMILDAMVALSMRLFASGSRERWQMVALLGCLAPLISLLFYRNTFPYFIPFITAPAFVAVAFVIDERKWDRALLAIIAAGMLISASLLLPRIALDDQFEQRRTIDAVHRIFPQPVHFIDASSMIASFPREGFFMSGWGMAEYRKRPPFFEARLRGRQIPLLLANGAAFERGLGIRGGRNDGLHPEDRQVLRENYIPHWGPVWVAGKQVRLGADPTQIEILVPGRYTVEGATVTLDGREYRPGDIVTLSRRTYRLSGKPGREVTLRWGDHLARPSAPAPVESVSGGM